MKSKGITIKEIAREASVSIAAVSQAINSTGRLSEKTRRKVLVAARRLKYHPNRHARNLVTRNSRTLGLIVSDVENPFYAVVMKNFEAHARRYHLDVITSETSYDLALMRRAGERMLEQDVSGVAIMTSEMSSTCLKEIMDSGTPLVVLDLDSTVKSASNIKLDHHAALQQLLTHLYHLGHRHIGYVGGKRKLKNILSRGEAYYKVMSSLGLEAGPVLTGNQRLDGGYAAGLAILGMASRPTAVVAVNDLTAVGLISAFCENGLQVPQDISVTGFDNTYLAAYFVPRLTTIDAHPDLLGRIAADALHDAITSPNNGAKEYAMKLDLVVGKSTGPVPADSQSTLQIPTVVTASGTGAPE